MAKKVVCILILALLAAGSVCAQAAAKKHNVIVDAAPLVKGIIASDSDTSTSFFGIGADYQYILDKSLSIGGRMDFIAGKMMKLNAVYFGLAVHGRYYLTAMLERAFLDAGLGFNTASVDDEEVFSGLTLELKAGYTAPLGKTLRLEPTLAYILAKSGVFPTPIGLQIGLGIGFSL